MSPVTIGTKFEILKNSRFFIDFSLIWPSQIHQTCHLAAAKRHVCFSGNRGAYLETEDRYQKSVLQIFSTYSEPVLSEYEALTPNSGEDYRVARRLEVFGSKMIEILKDSLMKWSFWSRKRRAVLLYNLRHYRELELHIRRARALSMLYKICKPDFPKNQTCNLEAAEWHV